MSSSEKYNKPLRVDYMGAILPRRKLKRATMSELLKKTGFKLGELVKEDEFDKKGGPFIHKYGRTTYGALALIGVIPKSPLNYVQSRATKSVNGVKTPYMFNRVMGDKPEEQGTTVGDGMVFPIIVADDFVPNFERGFEKITIFRGVSSTYVGGNYYYVLWKITLTVKQEEYSEAEVFGTMLVEKEGHVNSEGMDKIWRNFPDDSIPSRQRGTAVTRGTIASEEKED